MGISVKYVLGGKKAAKASKKAQKKQKTKVKIKVSGSPGKVRKALEKITTGRS